MHSFHQIQFPSIIEGHQTALKQVAGDLLHGLKLYEKKRAYLIGHLALSEGVAPHKNINASPGEIEYLLLAKAAVLLASDQTGQKRMTVTTGFPSPTYHLYRELAISLLQKEHVIEFDGGTFGPDTRRHQAVDLERVEVMTEIAGCVLALREGETRAEGNFFVISLGFGTCEAILSTESGTVQRTTASLYGLRYAVNSLMNDISKQHYLELQNEHQLDLAFQKGFLFSNRKRVDLREARERALHQYYHDVISPALRKAFLDTDFQRADRMYLVGGGAHYTELVDLFKAEFKDITDVVVPNDPLGMASIGYAIHSVKCQNGHHKGAVGLDLGNASTIVSFVNNQQAGAPVPRQQQRETSDSTDTLAKNTTDTGSDETHFAAAPAYNTAASNSLEPIARAPLYSLYKPLSRAERWSKFLQTGMW
jgi:plasmid segregation protein ParM